MLDVRAREVPQPLVDVDQGQFVGGPCPAGDAIPGDRAGCSVIAKLGFADPAPVPIGT